MNILKALFCKKNKLYINFTLLLLFFGNVSRAQNDNFIKKSGDYLQIALPVTALASTYFYQGDDKPYWQFAKSFLVSTITTQVLKRTIQKPRPDGSDNLSFPSGHTNAAFMGAGFLQMRYGWKIGVPAYLLASYVGYTRIALNKHDIWDVIAGASIGIGSNLLFVKKYHSSGKQVFIGKYNEYYVISFNYRF